MSDQWHEVAGAICDGLDVGIGARVAITVTDVSAAPLTNALVEEIYARGGTPQVILASEGFDRSARRHADDDILREPAALEVAAIAWADVYIALRAMIPPDDGPAQSAATAAEETRRTVLQRLAKGYISTLRWQQTRWAIVRVPTPEWARWAGIDEQQLIAETIAGCLMDWGLQRRRWEELTNELRGAREVRIVSGDTDLTLSIEGRSWATFAGEANFPDGEIATAPVDDGVDGHITFPGPFVFADTIFRDLRLTFDRGECVAVQASEGEEIARGLIRADAGSYRLGELGIGVNHLIRSMVGDLFIDEKILGTVHVALGRAYPECGGVNRSSVHWDLVKDLRPDADGRGGGDLLVDGVPLLRAGQPVGLFAKHLDPEALPPAPTSQPLKEK